MSVAMKQLDPAGEKQEPYALVRFGAPTQTNKNPFYQQMGHARKEESTWWEDMMCLEEEFSTATMEPGIMCVLMTGTPLERKKDLSAKLWGLIMVIHVYIVE